MSHVTTSSDPLSVEVAELLQRTDTMLSGSSAAGRALSENGRSFGPSAGGQGSVSRGGALGGGASAVGGGGDALSEAASRMRSSYDVARSKLSLFKKTASFKEPLSVDIPASHPDAPTPRFSPLSPSRVGGGGTAGSVALTDPSIERILDRSASMSLPSPHRAGGGASGGGGGGRTYNSFAGLQDMVSMVDEMVTTAPTSPKPLGAFGGAGLGRTAGRLGAGGGGTSSIGGGASKGSGVGLSSDGLRSPGVGLRPFSRFGGSATPSPRSPLRKSPGLGGATVPAASPGAKGGSSRRAQLLGLLGKDLAAPYEVVKFKTDVGAQGARPPANLAALAGNLQEKFDRVNRKLKNWELVETAASERFNNAMDAALDAMFARVNLAWPTASDGAAGAPTPAATSAAAAAPAAKPSSRAASARSADARPRSAPRGSSGDADPDVRVTVGRGRHRNGSGSGRDRHPSARYDDPDMETPSSTTTSSSGASRHGEDWEDEDAAEASSGSADSESDTEELKDGTRRSGGSKLRKADGRRADRRQHERSGSAGKAGRRRGHSAGASGGHSLRETQQHQQHQPHQQPPAQQYFPGAAGAGAQAGYPVAGNGYAQGMWSGAVSSPQYPQYGGGHSYPLPSSPPVGLGAGMLLQPPTSPRPPVGTLPVGMSGPGPLLTHMLGSPPPPPPPAAASAGSQPQWHSTLSVPSGSGHVGLTSAYPQPGMSSHWPTQPLAVASPPPHYGAGAPAPSSPLSWSHQLLPAQTHAQTSASWVAAPAAPHYPPAGCVYAPQFAVSPAHQPQPQQHPQQQQQHMGASLGSVSALGTMSFYAYPGHTAAALGAPPSPPTQPYAANGQYAAPGAQRPYQQQPYQHTAAPHQQSPGSWPAIGPTPATPADPYMAFNVSPQSPTAHKPPSGQAFAQDQRMSYAQHLLYAYGR
ncbi:hypothetical protein HXX76_010053 [Chlamydomonas incerta]|uniref:Uncharacterized protein n=1 Tax=Chlamydomonas incerta TaxID=51695 RepID=A0A835T147_CHLIN|nr:hypothetical protein HXX76_010053 [Chlamydomonas incerta]|eukprot:KAG2430530.1 hypothetical protein HXX76_010053 [Chlamydomonas incerta]